MRIALVVVAGLAVITLGLGCGGDDAPGESEARETAERYLRAAANADPAQCDLITEAARTYRELQLEPAGQDLDCKSIAEIGKPIDASSLAGAAEDSGRAEVQIRDRYARITFPGTEGFVELFLVAEDGEWRVQEVVSGSG